ncbi:hypothetical protein Vadar_014764 [Vaccinium darrowii]|uniref:Uncharacterized protein n=1 Tax=Vaccinium darrowii TaxID=229202 RepID=A0ACB7XAC5_9ERIC|nr:hypothetical protein Vadar_014764 [Vaccinium darrowii]
MERQIWKELPEELREAVLARLPMATVFRFRVVCRKWNSLLTSHRFWKQFEELQLSWPWIYAVDNHERVRAVYDPSVRMWHRCTTIRGVPDVFFCPVASAGGLVCLIDVRLRRYYVGNPLTQSFKELPVSGDIPSYVAVGMTLNWGLTSGGYKILQVDLHGNYEVYDSIENSWTPGSIPFNVMMNLTRRHGWTQTVSIGDTIYFRSSCPQGIVSYNAETRVWQQFTVPTPSHLGSDWSVIAECAGKIMLVGLLIDENDASPCVCIWELQKVTLSWKEVDRMPEKFHEKLTYMFCFGNKGLVFLYVPSRPINRLVAYNLLTREWVEVPSCVLPGESEHRRLGCGVAFHPCPAAQLNL